MVGNPPLNPITFISDAAGAAIYRFRGITRNISQPGDRGVASLGFHEQHYFFLSVYKWTSQFLNKFLSHSSVFEGVGLLLPFLSIPKQLQHKNILLLVDNEPLVHGWVRRYTKRSFFTSILLQSLHLMEATLPCRIFILHQKRCSTIPATLVDKLSRSSTTDQTTRTAIRHLPNHQPSGPLLTWLQNPTTNDHLPFTIADYVHSILLS